MKIPESSTGMKARNIAVPLTDEEKAFLDDIKATTGKAIGFWVREAILERRARELSRVVSISGR